MKRCPHCLSHDLEWTPVQGRGTLCTWTVVHRAFSAEFADKVPYVVGLVEFPDAPGVRLITQIVETSPAALKIDMTVEPILPGSNESQPLVYFRPVDISPD